LFTTLDMPATAQTTTAGSWDPTKPTTAITSQTAEATGASPAVTLAGTQATAERAAIGTPKTAELQATFFSQENLKCSLSFKMIKYQL
jgi:hypothetical protein